MTAGSFGLLRLGHTSRRVFPALFRFAAYQYDERACGIDSRAVINDDRAGGLDALACSIDSRAVINDDRAGGNDALACSIDSRAVINDERTF